ncbi:MAG: phosphoglycerate kinase, partial [Vicingaceae bacterium]
MKQIKEYNFSGKRALVRLDLNVPLNEKFEVTDTTRIDAAVPTILKIVNDGGAAILISHLGRPKGERNGKYSLKHIVSALSQKLGKEVKFVSDCIGDEVQKAAATLDAGEVLLLENLRFYKAETEGDAGFA